VANLGAPVNSAGDEYEFEIAPDGRRAVMMADRGDPSGGDLYLVDRAGQNWLAPRRLGPEINGPGLEVGPLFSRDGKQLYFSSRRSDTRLGDIYRVDMERLMKAAR
jgi:Tol biopolymer transport system component